MSVSIDPSLMKDLRRYGAFDISACFNCGNCTAVCPLASEGEPFPRRFIRYGQVGMKDRLLSARELWLCYYCAQCSDTCPRQAEPGEYMATLRRYAIANYDVSRLSRLLYTSPLFNVLFHLALYVVIVFFFITNLKQMDAREWKLFEFLPFDFVHHFSMGVVGLVTVFGALNVLNMIVHMWRGNGLGKILRGLGIKEIIQAAWATAVGEIVLWKRYRTCNEDHDSPWYLQPWFAHAGIALGMFGLFAATGIDYLLDTFGLKQPGYWNDPIGIAVRSWGTFWGLAALYGATVAIWRRLAKVDKMAAHALNSDWSFLIILWLALLTGFILEAAIIVPTPHTFGYWMLVFHMAIGMELVLIIPFTKFAHMIYRSLALFIHELALRAKEVPAQAETAPAQAGH